MPVTQSLAFEPSVGFILPWRAGADGFAKQLTSYFGLDFAVRWGRLKWRAGPGLQWNLLLTQYGAVDLDNATATTTFFVPSGGRSTFLLLMETGLELQLSQQFSLGWDFWFSEIANSDRRRICSALYLGVSL